MTPSIKQTLVEFMESVATHKQARWGHHNYCYLNFQMSVKNAVEQFDSFHSLPVAFPSQQELIHWANANKQIIEYINKVPDKPIITHGSNSGPGALLGASFIWVKASSPSYRAAIVFWLNTLRRNGDLRHIQKEASEVYLSVADYLESHKIRKRMNRTQRKFQINELKTLSQRCLNASSTEAKALREVRVLEVFDSTLDADHVINKKSLTSIPDAWVMLAPVIASSNRSFGRVIERYATKFTACKGAIGLDAVTAFKLFASTMPRTDAEISSHLDKFTSQFVAKQLNLERELQTVFPIVQGFINGTLKSFKR